MTKEEWEPSIIAKVINKLKEKPRRTMKLDDLTKINLNILKRKDPDVLDTLSEMAEQHAQGMKFYAEDGECIHKFPQVLRLMERGETLYFKDPTGRLDEIRAIALGIVNKLNAAAKLLDQAADDLDIDFGSSRYLEGVQDLFPQIFVYSGLRVKDGSYVETIQQVNHRAEKFGRLIEGIDEHKAGEDSED